MKRLFALAIIVSLAAIIGCSDDNPVKPKDNGPANVVTTTWNDSGFWRTTLDANNATVFKGFSFTTKDTTSSSWDIAFRIATIKLDGGTSTTDGGNATGHNLDTVDFDSIVLADTAGISWQADGISFAVDDWYIYTGPPDHLMLPTKHVYSMVDAEGDNYIKFRIDSLVGAAQPPDMGTVYLTYYYQPTANSKDLSGTTSTASVVVESGTAYFDFSSGSTVSPTDPSTSTDWDIAFSAYDVMLNSGPHGPGVAAAFDAYATLTDSTNIDEYTAQPTGPSMVPDGSSSVFSDWYNYTGEPLHRMLSKDYVYLVKVNGKVYKMKIESYYANIGGVLTSRWYTFIWKEL